jgi:hypothetical protein
MIPCSGAPPAAPKVAAATEDGLAATLLNKQRRITVNNATPNAFGDYNFWIWSPHQIG